MSFAFLYGNPRRADVEARYDDGVLLVHSAVLARCSATFRNWLFDPDAPASSEDDLPVLDMRGHDRFFMRVVYGCDEAPSLALLFDAIFLAHKHDAIPEVISRLRYRLGKSARRDPLDALEAWPFWKQPDVSKSYEEELSLGVCDAEAKGGLGCLENLPVEAVALFCRNPTRFGGDYFSVMWGLHRIWEARPEEERALIVEAISVSATRATISRRESLVQPFFDLEADDDEFKAAVRRAALLRFSEGLDTPPLERVASFLCESFLKSRETKPRASPAEKKRKRK